MRCYLPLNLPQIKEQQSFSCPQDCADNLMNELRYLEHEEFWCIALNAKNKAIAKEMLFKGSLTGSVIHPREIYRFAILNNAAAIVVAHNHPSGDPHPSREDNRITKGIYKSGEIIGIPLLDHIIIGDGTYYSYQEEGKLKGDD